MRVLLIGDVVASVGCQAVRRHLPALKKLYRPDAVIINGENSADGNGITKQSCDALFTAGADVITTGNHVFRRSEIYDRLEEDDCLLRPANFAASAPGKGVCLLDLGKWQLAVINLAGVSFMEPAQNPFDTADRILQDLSTPYRIVDFHAEATGEKGALGYYLDGRVSAVIGTHTHVQTNDACILPKGTGFLTDVGMTGPSGSVLGVKPELIIAKLRSQVPVRFENPRTPAILNGVLVDLEKNGTCSHIETIFLRD